MKRGGMSKSGVYLVVGRGNVCNRGSVTDKMAECLVQW